MSILITGSTGFIGKRLVDYFRAKEENINTLLRRASSDSNEFICNLGEDKVPSEALNGVKTVYHLAGLAHDTSNINDEILYKKINVEGSLELAKKAIECGVENFIFLSSVKAGRIGDDDSHLNLVEVSELDSPYSRSKREAEIRLKQLCDASSTNLCIVRPSLVYGPNVKGNLYLLSKFSSSFFFPSLIDFTNKKSMIHVDDLVIFLYQLHVNNENDIKQIFILTDGLTYSSSDIMNSFTSKSKFFSLKQEHLKSMAKFFLKFGINLDKLSQDDYYISKLQGELGFKPKFTIDNIYEEIF